MQGVMFYDGDDYKSGSKSNNKKLRAKNHEVCWITLVRPIASYKKLFEDPSEFFRDIRNVCGTPDALIIPKGSLRSLEGNEDIDVLGFYRYLDENNISLHMLNNGASPRTFVNRPLCLYGSKRQQIKLMGEPSLCGENYESRLKRIYTEDRFDFLDFRHTLLMMAGGVFLQPIFDKLAIPLLGTICTDEYKCTDGTPTPVGFTLPVKYFPEEQSWLERFTIDSQKYINIRYDHIVKIDEEQKIKIYPLSSFYAGKILDSNKYDVTTIQERKMNVPAAVSNELAIRKLIEWFIPQNEVDRYLSDLLRKAPFSLTDEQYIDWIIANNSQETILGVLTEQISEVARNK